MDIRGRLYKLQRFAFFFESEFKSIAIIPDSISGSWVRGKGLKSLFKHDFGGLTITVELDNLDVKILTLLQKDSRQSFREIAKLVHTSTPTVKSRVEKLQELGVIERFTIDINHEKLGTLITGFIFFNVKPSAIQNITEQLSKFEEIREIYLTSDSDIGIIASVIGDIKKILDIQNHLDLSGINHIRVIFIKNKVKKDIGVFLETSSISVICDYCGKKITEGAVKKKIEDSFYYFCCNTCETVFKNKYDQLKQRIQSKEQA
ncbi:MAG: AsnC family transcriptional regulator [Methanosarcinales archaeon]